MPCGYRAGSYEQDLRAEALQFGYLPYQIGHNGQVQLLVGRPGGKNAGPGLDDNTLVRKPV
jgi:hypothetical protein